MKVKDLMILSIRFVGMILLFLEAAFVIPSAMFSMGDYDYGLGGVWMWTSIIITIALLITLMARAPKVVTLLKLDKGFDSETISLTTVPVKQLIQLGLILLGLYFLIDPMPSLIYDALQLTKEKMDPTFKPVWSFNYENYSLLYLLQMLFGLGLLAFNKALAGFVTRLT